MEEKKNLSATELRKIVCERCRSRVACKKKDDAVITACPITVNYAQNGKLSFPMDDWY